MIKRAHVYSKQASPTLALNDLNQLISLEPTKHPAALTQRSEVYLQLSNFDAALNDINEAIRLNPEESYFFAVRAHTYFSKNNLSAAKKDLTMALKLDANQTLALIVQGHIYDQEKNWTAALENCRQINQKGKSAPNLIRMARIYQILGNHNEAILNQYEAYELQFKQRYPASLRDHCIFAFFKHESSIYTKGDVFRLNPDEVRKTFLQCNINPITLETMRRKQNPNSFFAGVPSVPSVFNQLDNIDAHRHWENTTTSQSKV